MFSLPYRQPIYNITLSPKTTVNLVLSPNVLITALYRLVGFHIFRFGLPFSGHSLLRFLIFSYFKRLIVIYFLIVVNA